jgi:hypothetical protein
MSAKANLLKNFQTKSVPYGEELVIFNKFCLDFIRESKFANLAIIGVEGFYLSKEEKVQPNINEIADFSVLTAVSWGEYVEKCTTAADVFIKNMLSEGESDGYCFVMAEQSEI